MMTGTRDRLSLWNSLIVLTGFCSLVYELIFAQLLAGLLGNAFARFATTLGVYIVGLGIGSILFTSKDEPTDRKLFFRAELVLSALGLVSPFLFVAFNQVFSESPHRDLGLVLSTHAVIFCVGFVSGWELPVLTSILSHRTGDGESRVLGFDYFGMFLASVSFPIMMVGNFGLLTTLFIVTFMNLSAALATFLVLRERTRVEMIALLGLLILNAAFLFNIRHLEAWMSLVYAPPS